MNLNVITTHQFQKKNKKGGDATIAVQIPIKAKST